MIYEIDICRIITLVVETNIFNTARSLNIPCNCHLLRHSINLNLSPLRLLHQPPISISRLFTLRQIQHVLLFATGNAALSSHSRYAPGMCVYCSTVSGVRKQAMLWGRSVDACSEGMARGGRCRRREWSCLRWGNQDVLGVLDGWRKENGQGVRAREKTLSGKGKGEGGEGRGEREPQKGNIHPPRFLRFSTHPAASALPQRSSASSGG
jgi:hypothetical protein